MAKKKLSRKQIRQDPLVTLTLNVTQFVETHFTKVVGGLVILVAALAVVLFMANSRRNSALAAEQEMAVAMDQWLLDQKEEASATFLAIADKYSGHTAGQTALYFLGECYLSLNRFNEAVDAYDRYIARAGQKGFFTTAAKIGKATAYETLLQFDMAAATLEDVLAQMDDKDPRYADLLFRTGTFYEEQRDDDKALEFYKRAEDVATGRLKDRAAVRIALLER